MGVWTLTITRRGHLSCLVEQRALSFRKFSLQVRRSLKNILITQTLVVVPALDLLSLATQISMLIRRMSQ